MTAYGGVKFVLDLEACLEFQGAGANRKASLFGVANSAGVAITDHVFRELKGFDTDLAEEFVANGVKVVECDETIYRRIETLMALLAVSEARIDAAASDKLIQLSLVNCAQNGTLPKCKLVTGDYGKHKSSMAVIGKALDIEVVFVNQEF